MSDTTLDKYVRNSDGRTVAVAVAVAVAMAMAVAMAGPKAGLGP